MVEVKQMGDKLHKILLSLHQVEERVGENLYEGLGLEDVPTLLLTVVDFYQVLQNIKQLLPLHYLGWHMQQVQLLEDVEEISLKLKS